MKILQLSKYYPPTHGGLEQVAEFFSRTFIDLGYSVDIVSLGNKKDFYHGLYGENVYQAREDIKLGSSPLSIGYYQHVKHLIEKEAPQFLLVHLPNPFAHEVIKHFFSFFKEKKIKILGIYHSDIINQVVLRDAYNLYFSNHLHVYDYFICSSRNLKNSSSILSKLSDDKVKVIPFCVEHSFMAKSQNRNSQFNGKFLTIGRMVPYKGYEFLIQAFKNLPYTLTVVGNGPLKDKLKAMASPNVHFAGQITEEEKFNLLTSHDALIMSSINRAEAYGMTIVEAFSVGLPVIASNIDTGVSFLVRDGETGYKFPIKDEAGLLAQIESVARDPQTTQRLSKACRDFFNTSLNYSAFRENLKRLIAEIS